MRSYLYVPADNQRFLEKAESSSADAIILDLEDSVKLDAKTAAEESLRSFLNATNRKNLLLRVEPSRINKQADLINHEKITKIYLPKANSPKAIDDLNAKNQSNKPVHALIENAAGLEHISEIATANNVASIGIGEADFFAEISMSSDVHPALKNFVRSKVVIASSAYNLQPPVAPVSSNFKDLDAYAAETREFLALGYWGRACIHPAQVEIANEIFAPDQKLVAKAQDIIAALANSAGGAATDSQGAMIDAAHLKWAQRYLGIVEK
jgi:citrate lyase subunit beta/citryl-CoA lyase